MEEEEIPQFAKRLKEKFPEYNEIDDFELVERVVRKHPVYASQVKLPQGFSLLQTTSGYPEIDKLYEEAGREYNVDPNLILEQGRKETRFKPDVFYGRQASPKGAVGAGQFMPGTAPTYGVQDRTDPRQSIKGQAKYMRKLLDDFDGDENLALAGYNSGEYRKSLREGRVPDIAETQDYVKEISESLAKARSQKTKTLRELLGGNITPTTQGPVAQLPSVKPVTESLPTIEEQVRSALDANSPRAGVLLTDPNQEQYLDSAMVKPFKKVKVKEGVLLVNPTKTKGITDYQSNMAAIIGKVDDVGQNTVSGPTVLTTMPDGTEAAASLVTSPEAAQTQAALDQHAHPGATSQVVDAQDVVAQRLSSGVPGELSGDPLESSPSMISTDPGYLAFLRATGLPDGDAALKEYQTVQQTLAQQQQPQTNREKLDAINRQRLAPKSEQPAGTVSTTFGREVGQASDDFMREIGTSDVDPKWTPQQKLSATLNAQLSRYGVTPQEVDAYIESNPNALAAVRPNTTKLSATFANLAEIKGTDYAQSELRREQAEGRTDVPARVDAGTPGRLPEPEAEKALEERIQDPSYSYAQMASEAILGGGLIPFLMSSEDEQRKKGESAYRLLHADPTVSDEWLRQEKQRLLKQHGTYSKAWEAEKYFRDSGWGEKVLRTTNQAMRSFAKNLISGTAKSVAFVDGVLEDIPLGVNALLSDDYKISLRNAGNTLDFLANLLKEGDRTAAVANTNWAGRGDISKTHLFRAAQEFDKAVGDDPVLKGRFLGSLGDAAGSAAAFIALGVLMPSLQVGRLNLSSGFAGALQSAGTGYEEGKQAGLDESKARAYGGIQALLGTTEMLGAGNELAHFLKNPAMRRSLALGIMDAAKRGAVREGKQEFFQEVFQTTGGKIALEYLRDNDPSTFNKIKNALNRLPKQLAETVTNEGPIAALTGGLLGGATGALETAGAQTVTPPAVADPNAPRALPPANVPPATETEVEKDYVEGEFTDILPRALTEGTGQRIAEPDSKAVAKARIDTNVGKVTEALRQQSGFVDVDTLAKAAKVNPAKVEDAILTLYGAGVVEIMPDSRVRLVAELPKTDLFEKAKTYGQTTPEIPSQPAQVATPPVVSDQPVAGKASAPPIAEPSSAGVEKPAAAAPETPIEYAEPVTTAQQARDAGRQTIDGVEYQRQPVIDQPRQGRTGQVKFAEAEAPKEFKFAVIEADQLQPAHLGGQRNRNHFLPEAQPKARTDAASKMSSDRIGENPDLGQLGDSPTAYSGAPIINTRGEAIQGNNRSEGILKHYAKGGTKYKQDLAGAAEQFGLKPEDVTAMNRPVLVRMVDSDDDEAIRLGNFSDLDMTSGGKQFVDPVATSARIPHAKKAEILEDIFRDAPEDATLTQIIRDNRQKIKVHLNPVLTPTQMQTLFNDATKDFTPRGVADVEQVLTHFLFEKGDEALPEMFDKLPAATKGAVVASLPKIFGVDQAKSIVPEIQVATMAADDFIESGSDWKTWLRQPDMIAGTPAPIEMYTPVEQELTKRFIGLQEDELSRKTPTQKDVKELFAKYARLVNGTQGDMFGGAEAGLSKADALKEIFGVEYAERPARYEAPGEAERSEETADEAARTQAAAPAEPATRTLKPDERPIAEDILAQDVAAQAERAMGSFYEEPKEKPQERWAREFQEQSDRGGSKPVVREKEKTNAPTQTKTETVLEKEPWQMSGSELLERRDAVRRGEASKVEPWETTRDAVIEYRRLATIEESGQYAWDKMASNNVGLQHRRAVEKAIADGKTIPAKVLADYPDLTPKTESRRPTLHGVPPQELTPLMHARVLYDREQGKTPSDIAEKYNLSIAQVESVGELPKVGSGGQMAHKLIQSMIPAKQATEAEIAEKIAFANDLAAEIGLTDVRLTRDAKSADIKNASDLIRLTIAKEMGRDRGSHMTAKDWLTWLDRHGDSISYDSIALVLDAFEHQSQHTTEKVKPFVNDKMLVALVEDINKKIGLVNVRSYRDLPKETRAKIQKIGYSYGLRRTAIERSFSQSFLDTSREKFAEGRNRQAGARSTPAGEAAEAAEGRRPEEELDDIPFNRLPETQTETPEFKAWFGDWQNDPENASKVVDEDGEPLIVYHGTTHDFAAFDPARGSIENHFGRGIYLTDSRADLESNYAGEGPDLTARIEQQTERLEGAIEDRLRDKGSPLADNDKQIRRWAKVLARRGLKGSEGFTMPLYADIKNPVYIGVEGKKTWIEPPSPDVGEEPEFGTPEWEEWEDARFKSMDEHPLMDAIRNAAHGLDEIDTQQIIEDLGEILYEPVTATDLDATLRKSEGVMYATDDNGDLASHEFIKEVFRNLGFDGVIMDADTEFGSGRKIGKQMQMDYGTKHYIAFEPNQVKSVFNRGTFSRTDDDILFTQVDLFGNVFDDAPAAQQDSLFDLGVVARESEAAKTETLESMLGKETAHYLKSLAESPDAAVAKNAKQILNLGKFSQAGKKQIIEDAADALDIFARAKQTKTPVADMIRQGWLGVDVELSDRAKTFARNMESGEFGTALKMELSRGVNEPLFMTAWHGSPHTFDKFDISKIGTGEGAQAYGHGLYFTDKESIAEHYKQTLSTVEPKDILVKGKSLDDLTSLDAVKKAFLNYARLPNTERWHGLGLALKKEIDFYQDAIKQDTGEFWKADDKLKQLRNFDGLVQEDVKIQKGAKYKVNLKPAEDEYLLWDKPLSEQSEKVKKALASSDRPILRGDWPIKTLLDPQYDKVQNLPRSGNSLYFALMNSFGAYDSGSKGRAASEYLKSLGIRGIKYLDGSSRRPDMYQQKLWDAYDRNGGDVETTVMDMLKGIYGEKPKADFEKQVRRDIAQGNGRPDYNYVIFDDADVEITDIQFRTLDKEAAGLRKAVAPLDRNAPARDLILKSQFGINDKTGMFEMQNPHAIALMQKVFRGAGKLGQGGGFIGAYLNPNNTQIIGDALRTIRDRLEASGEKAGAAKAGKIAAMFEKATDPKHQDVSIAINAPDYPELSKYTGQEEIAHRTNRRSGARSLFTVEFAETPAIKKSLDNLVGYDTASDITRMDEVIAKSFRDDAAETLGLSEAEVWDNLNTFWAATVEAGIDLADYADVSPRGKEFYERSQREQRNVETQPERAGVRGLGPEDIQAVREERNRGRTEAGTIAEDDRFARLRQADLSTAARRGDSGERTDNRSALISPAERAYIQKHTRGNTELAQAVEDEVQFARMAGEPWTVGGVLIDIAAAPKSIKTAVDLSAFRQAGILAIANPKIGAKAFAKQFGSFAPFYGEKYFNRFKRDLNLHAAIELAEESDLYLSSLRDQHSLVNREEAFMSRLFSDDPVFTNKALEFIRRNNPLVGAVRMSERAYVTMLDSVRINVFDKLARQLHDYNVRNSQPDDIEQYKALAKFINYATGRGGLGPLKEEFAPLINATIFSLRYWTSRLQLLNPMFYKNLPPGVRGMVMKQMATFLGGVALTALLLKLAGADIEWDDTTDPSMLKIKFGNWQYDLGFGLLQHVQYLAKMIEATTRPDPAGRMEYVTERYLRSKLSPTAGAAVNVIQGKNYIGEPTSLREETLGRRGPLSTDALGGSDPITGGGLVSPIMVNNFMEAARAEGLPGAAKMVPEFFGVSTTRYNDIKEIQAEIAAEAEAAKKATTPAEKKEAKRRIDAWKNLIKRANKYAKEDQKEAAANGQ